MNALSIRKLFLIVICLLAASVLIDFAHMVLSMIIDSVLAVAMRLIPLSQVHRLMTDRPRLRCAHRPDEIRWLSCDGVAVA